MGPLEPIGELRRRRHDQPDNELFAKALGVAQPWFVKGVDFDAAKREMIVRIDFVRGTPLLIPRPPANTRYTIPRSSGCGTPSSFSTSTSSRYGCRG